MMTYLENVYHEVPNEVLTGAYEDLRTKEILGDEGFFIIVDEKGTLIYNASNTDIQLTKKDLNLIPEENNRPIVTKEVYEEFSSNTYMEFTFEYYKALEKSYQLVLVVDELLNVDYTNLPDVPEQFSFKSLELIQGRYDDYAVSKLSYDNHCIVFFRHYNPLNIISMSLEDSLGKSMILFVFVFILLSIVYFIALYSRVKKPLSLLTSAIEDVSQNRQRIDYHGPEEFEAVCLAFNEMLIKLKRSEEERKVLEEDRKQFITNISHDLKTPLTIAKGYTRALLDDKYQQEEKQYLNQIDVQLNKVTELMTALNTFNNLEYTTLELTLNKENVCEFVRQYIIDIYQDIQFQGYQLITHLPDEGIYCNIHQFQMKRVLDNIVFNTLKHTPKGTDLYVEVEDGVSMIHIYIGDNGPGIPESFREEIFKPLTTLETSRHAQHGTGLGMAIADSIVKAHQGTLSIMNTPKANMTLMYHIQLNKANIKKS